MQAPVQSINRPVAVIGLIAFISFLPGPDLVVSDLIPLVYLTSQTASFLTKDLYISFSK